MRAMPGILPPSRNPGGDYWCVCRNTNWLQTQKIEQEEQPNYSGPLWAPGWSPDAQRGWVCSLISVFTLCSHTQTHTDAGLERCGRSKTAPNSNIHSQGRRCWFTSKCCQLSRCAITHRQRRCRWWQPSRGWKTEGHPIPTTAASSRSCQPGHSLRPVLKIRICKCHTLGQIVPASILVWASRNPILGSYLREILKPEVIS